MACILVYETDGEWGITRDRTHTARTEHKCSECGRKIIIGEVYEYSWGVWSGEQDTYKTCSDCLSARKAFFGSQWVYGMIWDYIFEEEDFPVNVLDKLTPRALNRVVDWIDNGQ